MANNCIFTEIPTAWSFNLSNLSVDVLLGFIDFTLIVYKRNVIVTGFLIIQTGLLSCGANLSVKTIWTVRTNGQLYMINSKHASKKKFINHNFLNFIFKNSLLKKPL